MYMHGHVRRQPQRWYGAALAACMAVLQPAWTITSADSPQIPLIINLGLPKSGSTTLDSFMAKARLRASGFEHDLYYNQCTIL